MLTKNSFDQYMVGECFFDHATQVVYKPSEAENAPD